MSTESFRRSLFLLKRTRSQAGGGTAYPWETRWGLAGARVVELGAPGAARVGAGSGIGQAAHALVRAAARELLTTGTYGTPADGLAHGELNTLLGRD